MPYFTFNNGEALPLIEDLKLVRKLNRKYNRLSYTKKITTNSMTRIGHPRVYGYKSEIFHLFFNKRPWAKKVSEKMSEQLAIKCEPVIYGIGKVLHKGQTFFFCTRIDEYSEYSRLWFNMDEGTKVVNVND